MNGQYATSHAVIKALKGPADPPTPNGPSKIEIASNAWGSQDVYFPGRSEVLVDWILNSFLRKPKHEEESTLSSSDYWALLDSILSDSKSKLGSSTWLSSIAGKVPFSIISQNLIQSFPKLLALHSDELLSKILACFKILWPLASRRMNVDSLADCFGSTVLALSSEKSQALCSNIQIMAISSTVSITFRQSLSNSGNKKKVLANFLQKVLKSWIELMAIREPEDFQKDEIFLAGVDVLFSVDSLKSANVLQDVLDIFTSNTLAVLPQVYISYLDAARRHRFAIYGTSSTNSSEQTIQVNLTNAAMESFASVHKLLQVHNVRLEAWTCLLKVVLALEEKNLTGTRGNQVLSNVASHSLLVLTPGLEVYNFEIQDTALEVLHVLARIDFDVVGPLMPKIVSSLSKLKTEQIPSSLKLLSGLLGFHAKTRTLPSYISIILDCLSPSSRSDVDKAHISRSVLASPLLDGAHLREVSAVLRTFLTPGQTLALTESTLAYLRNAWASFDDSESNETMDIDVDETPKRKKRRHGNESGRTQAAISFASAARIASVVLASLPLDTLAAADQASVISTVQLARDDLFVIALRVNGGQEPLEWTKQLVVSSAFRLIHAISSNSKLKLAMKTDAGDDGRNELSKLRDENVSSDLVIETLRQFVDKIELGHAPAPSVLVGEAIDIILHHMKMGIEQFPGGERDWDGRSFTMDTDQDHYGGAIAIWSLALHRWLYIIDEFASEKQLDELAELIFRASTCVALRQPECNKLSVFSELQRSIHSGHFWETPGLRAAIERSIDNTFQSLDKPSLDKLFKKRATNERIKAPNVSLQTITSTFRFLLQAPLEYLSRSIRQNITRRAIAADIAISASSQKLQVNADTDNARLAIRLWIRGHIDILSTLEMDWVDFVFFLSQSAPSARLIDDLEEVSLGLIVDVFRLIFRGEDKIKSSLLRLLDSFAKQKRSDDFSQQVVCRFFEYMTVEGPSSKTLREEVLELLTGIHQYTVETAIRIDSRLLTQPTNSDEKAAVHHLRLVKATLAMSHYLGTSDVSSSLFKENFFGDIMSYYKESRNAELLVHAFGVIVEQLSFPDIPARPDHIDRVVAAYVHLFGQVSDTSRADEIVRKMSRSLSENDYTHTLRFLKEALLAEDLKVGMTAVIHISRIISTNGPEGTSIDAHELFQDFMQIFLSSGTYLCSSEALCRKALEFVQSHCTERPIFLGNLDVGTIFTILSRVLSQSSSHSLTSHPEILHAVVGVANSVLRYRRDLVTSALPHLGMVLRLLIFSLRTARQELGAKQAKQVSDSLPWWISSTSPSLGAAEARAVARLLTTLQAKTIPTVRMHNQNNNEQKAESLARPFSKHAPYVLTAYIDAMNDPLCSIPLPVRKELEPGLFALCNIMTEHGRDAIMVSIRDSGGKAALKSLWREYEKQRYVGKG